MYVHVYSGLMSRCITLAHAYNLIKQEGGDNKLVVIWPLETACGIHFREVFADEMFNDIKLKVIEITASNRIFFDSSKNDGVHLNIKKKHYGKAIQAAVLIFIDMLIKIKKNLPTYLFGKNYFDYTPSEKIGWSGAEYEAHLENIWKQIQIALSEHKRIYVRAYCGIVKGEEQENIDLSVIQFRNEYWQKVEKIVGSEDKYIGVHIRRSDHKTAISVSGTEAFIKKMDAIIEGQDCTKFFLATDDALEEKALQERYGDKLIVQPNKKWGRAESEEMKSGIVDCLCLSRCEYILGSYTSVFSSFAARYGKKGLIICKNE